jgi:DNA-binding PadR family transcriptional regulator
MKAKLKTAALAGLLAADGVPLPETALISHLQNSARPKSAGVAECLVVIRELEAERWIASAHDDLTNEASYTLTEKGKHKAQQL